jgi:hypothetical protein
LPTVTYGFQQTYQLGSIAATSSAGFSNPAQIPDQSNTTQQVGLDWTIGSEAVGSHDLLGIIIAEYHQLYRTTVAQTYQRIDIELASQST